MSRFVKGKSSDKAQVWLQRLVKFWLASGIIAMPWSVYGSEITRTDGGANINGTGVHNIYAGKQISDTVGASTFSKFDITQGDVANMHFRTSSVSTTNFNTLLNFVDAKINVNGTVNAIRNGSVDGHLYFLSPNGMAVGANGAINAGSLTVLTPTQNWWDNVAKVSQIKNNGLSTDIVGNIQNMVVPINASGSIAVQGKVNVTNDLRLKSAKINIGADGDGNSKTAAVLQSGIVDFADVVKLDVNQQDIAGITNLTAVRATDGGDIVLAAEVSYNANSDMDADKVNAELNVVGGSKITAARNVDLTAKALNNGNYLTYQEGNGAAANIKYVVNGESLTEEQFKEKYGDDKTGGTFKTDVKTSAIINITDTDTTIDGRNVNVVAEAQNILDNSMTKSLGENAFAVGMSVLFNGFDVCLGDLTNKAEVNIDKDVFLHATGLDGTAGGNAKNALNVQALATTQITVGTWAGSVGLTSVVPNPFKGVPSTGMVPSVMFNLAKGQNEANVKINGTLKADMGKINVGAIAKNSITSTADSGIMGSGLVGNSNAVLTIGINGVEGYNKSNIVVGSSAVIDAAGDVELDSHAISSIIAKTSLTTTEKSTMAFGIGWLDYENLSTIDLSGAVKAGGGITLDSMAKYTDNTFTVSVSAGQGFVANLIGDKFGVKNLQQSMLDSLSSKIGPAISKAITGEAGNFAQEGVDGKTVAEKLADKLKLGISFGYMKEKNVANVTVQPTATVISSGNKDITINAKATLEDVYTNVVGTSNNKEAYQAGSSSAAALVNGAIFLRNITNEGDLVIDARADGKTAAIQGGKITMDASATAPYNRVKYMVGQMEKYYNQINDIYPTWENPSDEDVKVLKKYHEAAMAKKAEIEAGLYDANGNLKAEYADQKTGSAELLKKMNEFQQTKEYKDYYKLLAEGKYIDDNGKEKTIGEGKTSGALEDIMAAKNLLTKGLLQMVNPQSYFSYSVSSEVNSRDSQEGGASKFGIGIAFGMDSFNNNTNILIGKNVYLHGTKDVTINAKADYGDINCNGGWLFDSAGTTGANMDLITIQHLNNNSIVAVAEGATIESEENITAKVTNDVNHIGINKPILTSEGGVAVIDVAYFTAESNTILSVDDEVKLDAAKTISLTGDNTTKGIVFTGAIAAGDTKAGAVSVAYLDIDRNNIVGIADNDGAGALAQADKNNKNTEATAVAKDDDEDTRMRKLLAAKSGLTQEKIISFYSDTLNRAGSVGANVFDVNVVTGGKLGNFVVDVAITSHDEENDGQPGMLSSAASWLGDKLKSFIGLKKSAVNDGGDGNQDMVEMQDLGGEGGDVNNQAGQQHLDNDGNEHQDAAQNQEPKLSFAGAGSGSFVELDAVTASVIKNTVITLKNDDGALKNIAKDNSLLVTVAGGAAASKTVEVNGGDSTSFVLTGSVSINDVSSKLFATIGNATISGAKKIDNLAIREGALANAAAAVSVVKTGGNSKNASGAFGAIVNLADYTTEAKLLNNTLNKEGSAVTDIVNQATDKDIQITGGIDVNIVKGGKKATGVGGVVSWAYLNNKVNSLVENGNYSSLGALAVEAVTDLTQINAALGIGVSGSTGGSKTFQGAAVRNKLVNNVKANIKSANITGNTLKVGAYDTNLSKINAYDNALKQEYGFDVDGKTYISHAQTQTTDENKTTKLEDSGNLIVSAAVEVAAATGAGSTASLGASAVVGIIDNDFNSIVEGSSITLSGDVGKTAEGNAVYPGKVWAESSTLQVGVAAGGNGSENGFAGGGSVVVNLFKNDVDAKVEGSTFNAAGLQVDAKNKQKLVNVAGQIDIGKSVIGLDMVFNYMLNNTGAYFTNSSIEKSTLQNGTKVYNDSNLVLDAANDSDIYAIALGVSVSDNAYGSTAANGSIAVNRGQNNVEAVAEKNATGERHLVGLKTFTVHSQDNSYLAGATGGLTLSAGKTAFGGSLTWNRLGSLIVDENGKFQADDNKKQENKAIISGYDIHMADKGVLTVQAEDIAKFNTVAIGLGIGTGDTKFTLQGANANAYISKETIASIVGGNINNDKNYGDDKHFADVNVTADTNNTFNTVSAVLATAKKVAIGAALIQDTMKADTKAAVSALGAAGSNYTVGNLLVKATSDDTIQNIALGVAASGKVALGGSFTDSVIDNDTEAELGGTGGGVTTVKSRGNIGVVSQSTELLKNIAGDANINLGGVFSGGASVALNEIKGNTLATVQSADLETGSSNDNKISLRDSIEDQTLSLTGLVVGADASHELDNAPFCGAFSINLTKGAAAAADATVAVDTISGTTGARILSADVNQNDSSSKSGKNVTVRSTDKTDVTTVVTNAALSVAAAGKLTVSVGAGVNVDKNTRTVEANITGDNKRKIIKADQLDVTAKSFEKLKAVNTAVGVAIGVGGVGIGVNAGVTSVGLDVTTRAGLQNVSGTNNGMNILADHKDDIDMTGTGVVIAFAGGQYTPAIALGIGVANESNVSKTTAYLEDSNIYHYADNQAKDTIRAVNDSTVNTQALGITAAAALLSFSVGILVANNDLHETAAVSVNNSLIGTEAVGAKNISLGSESKITGTFKNQNIDGALLGGVGVGVGKNYVRSGVITDVMNSQLYSSNDIDIKNSETVNLTGDMFAFSLGGASIGVSSLYNYFGSEESEEDYSDWDKKHSTDRKDSSYVKVTQIKNSESNFTAKSINERTESAMENAQDRATEAAKAAKARANSTVKIVPVVSDYKGNKINILQTDLHVKGNITVSAKEKITTNDKLRGGSVGLLSVQVEKNIQDFAGKVGVNITGGTWYAGNNITVDSSLEGSLRNDTVQAGGGGVQVGVTIGKLTKEEQSGSAVAANGAKLRAGNSISLNSKDTLGLENEVFSYDLGFVTAAAVDLIATDKSVTSITGGNNDMEANSISLTSITIPHVISNTNSGSVGILAGSGFVLESRANNKAVTSLSATNRFWGDDVQIISLVDSEDSNSFYSVCTDIFGVGAGGLNIAVNKAEAYTAVEAVTEAGVLTLKTKEVTGDNGKKQKFGIGKVVIGAKNNTKLKTSANSYNYGIINSGTNYSITKNENKVTATVKAGTGEQALYANNLTVYALNQDNVDAYSNGNGGGIVGISPRAAAIDAHVTGTTTVTLSGTFNITSTLNGCAKKLDELKYFADVMQVEAAGGAGVGWDVVGKEDTTLNLDAANITASEVNMYALTTVNLNKVVEQPGVNADSKGQVKKPAMAIDTRVYSLLDYDKNYLDNNWTITDKVNVNSGSMQVAGPINLTAYTDGNMGLYNYIEVWGIIFGAGSADSKNTVVLNDEIKISNGADLRTTEADNSITLSASDQLETTVSTEAKVGIGIASKTHPTVNNNLTRNNIIDIEKGKIFSLQDVNLYAGKGTDGTLSMTKLYLFANCYSGLSIIPISEAELDNSVVVNNVIKVQKDGDVRSVRNVDLYADTGNEIIVTSCKGYDNNEDSMVVGSKAGSKTGTNAKNSYVQVDGSVVAGVANKLSITIGSAEDRYVFVAGDDIQVANEVGIAVYSPKDRDKFISLGTTSEELKAAELGGITLDKFIFDTSSYEDVLVKRLQTVVALYEEYINNKNSDSAMMTGLSAEIEHLKALRDAAKTSPSTQYDCIILPDLVASGGNVNVNTVNFKGDGQVVANGSPSITVKNYTNLTMKVNDVKVEEPGGVISYNGKDLDQSKLQQQVKELNQNHNLTVATMKAAKGISGDITIKGLYNGEPIEYTKDNQRISYVPRADVVINGVVNSRKGNVTVTSDNNDIIIESKITEGASGKVMEAVGISGQVITISALKGSISQGYTDGIVNIGGNVKDQYSTWYDEFVKKNYSNNNDVSTVGSIVDNEPKDGEKADNTSASGKWIVGNQIYLNALEINVNGVMQSGFGEYYVNIDDSAVAKIKSIESNYIRNHVDVTDDTVLASESYRVVEGGAYWSSEDGCYKYRMNVYYNPVTKRLLTENINAGGGKISLIGRIASTGNGKLICLDGAYNIDVNNTTDYALQVRSLLVNDVKGEISITDTGRNNQVTKYTGDSSNLTYNPVSNLRYNWVSGHQSSYVSVISVTNSHKRILWIDYNHKRSQEETQAILAQSKEVEPPKKVSDEKMTDGVYVSNVADAAAVRFTHQHDHVSDKVAYTRSEEHRSGWLLWGSSSVTDYYDKKTGEEYFDYASVKADNPITIKFVGTTADQAHVNVTSKNDVYLKGSLGNTRLYESGGVYSEKGTVSLISNNGSIAQEKGAIYGNTVDLKAKINLDDIQISAGNTVNLKGAFNGIGDITVDATYGGGAGNVLLHNLGSVHAVELTLTAAGNIIQNSTDNLVEAEKITLVSGGIVSGQGTELLHLQGGQTADLDSSDNIASASVNITARGNINIQQEKGDLRVGKIYSSDGDIYISVPEGGILDALPYEDTSTNASAEILISMWQRMGLVKTTDAEGNNTEVWQSMQEQQQLAKNGANVYAQKVTQNYERYKVLSAKESLTQSEELELTELTGKFGGYISADNYLSNDSEYQQLKATCDKMTDTYQGWDQNALLYAIDESIINPDTKKELPGKDANLYGRNITLSVMDGVGLNDTEKRYVTYDELNSKNENYVEALKKIATADVGTVEKDDKNKRYVITPVSSVGVQHTRNGSISVVCLEEQEGDQGDIYLEGRKVAENIAALQNQCNDFYLKGISAVEGNIRLANSGSILAWDGDKSSVLITGDNMYLQAGQGDLGSVDNPLNLSVNGDLTALATDNVYLVELGGSDLHISNVLAGVKDSSYGTDSGNISITAKGNIFMSEKSHLGHPYIHSYTEGAITLVSESGSIGSKDRAIAIVNSSEAEVQKNHGQVSLTAKGGIYVEGISSKTGPNDFTEGVAPAGILNVVKAETGTHELQLTVNGGLRIPEVNFLDESQKLDGSLTLRAVNVNLSGQTAAAMIDIYGAYGIKQEQGILCGDNISLTTGEEFSIQTGKVIWDQDKLQDGDITQVNGQGKNSHLTAKNLQVSASGDINLNSIDNQLVTVLVDGGKDVFLAGTAMTEQPLQSDQTKVISLKVTNTHTNNEYTYTFAGGNEVKTNVVGGRVEVYIYGQSDGPVTDLDVKDDLLAAGDVVLYNSSGTVKLSGQTEQNIFADGTVLVYGGGNVITDVNYKSTGGIALVSEGDLDINAQTISTDGSLYLYSFEGSITDTNADKSLVSDIGGDLTLLADKGDVAINRSYRVKGDITIRAEDSIENECAAGLQSLTGDITIYTTGDDSEGRAEGWLINNAPLKADKGDVYIYAYNGVGNAATIEGEKVNIFSNGLIINGDLDANEDYIHGTKGINILAQGYLENTEVLWADNGNVLLGGIYDDATAGSTWAAFNGEIKNSGTIYVGTNGDVNVVSTGDLTNSGSIYTNAGSVNIASKGEVNNTAGMVYTGDGDVMLVAEKNLTNKSAVYGVNGEVYLESVTGNIVNYDDLSETITTGASKTVTMKAVKGSITNNSNIFAKGDIIFESGKGFYNYGDGNTEIRSTDGNITITATDNGTEGNIEINGTDVYAGKTIVIAGTGAFIGTANMEAKDGDLRLEAKSVNNIGDLTAAGDVRIDAWTGDMVVTGAIHAGGYILLNSEGNLTGIGSWSATNGGITVMGNDVTIDGDGASVTAAKQVMLWAQGNLSNQNSVQAGEGVDMLALDGQLTNKGTISAKQDVGLYGSAGILNTKDITSSQGGIDLSGDGKTENNGLLIALNAVELSGLGIENTNDVLAGRGVTMESRGILNNTGSIGTFGMITMQAQRNLDNTGDLFADGDICLVSSEGNISNSGTFDAKQTDEITMAGGAVIFKAEKGLIINTKAIEAEGDVTIKSRGSINYVDQAGFSVRSYTGDIEITSTGKGENEGWIYNKAGIKADEGSVKLVAQNDIYNESQLVAGMEVELNSSGRVYNRNTIDARTGIIITGDLGVENGNINANNLSENYAQTISGDIEIISSAGTVKNDAKLWTGNGSVYIEANGSDDSGYFANGLSVLNEANGDIIANGGNVVIKGAKGIENCGDIVATTGGKNYAGNIEIYSNDGGIALWSSESGEQEGGNIFKAESNLILYAPKEGLYSVKDLEAADDIKLILGGSKKDPATGEYLISINNSIHSAKGNITVMTEEKGTSLVLVAGAGISSDEGTVLFHSEGDVLVYGDISSGLDINIGAVDTAVVQGNLSAPEGSVVIGTENGDMMVAGEFSGERIVLYTEGQNANISVDLDKFNVTEELILAGNNWNGGDILDISRIDMDADGFALRLFSAGGNASGAHYNLSFGEDGRRVAIQDVTVDTIAIHASGPVEIAQLLVHDKAEIYTMGTKTDVYGRIQDYDGEAKVIYYAPVAGERSIDLHNMFFDGGRNTEQYQNEMDVLWAMGSDAFVNGNVGKGMYLDIRTATEQTGDGLLLRNYYGQTTYIQRYSLEQLMQNLLNYKAMDGYNRYFNTSLEIYEKYNLLEIPGITVNQSTNFDDRSFEIEGTTTNDKGEKVKKVVKYQF